MKNKLKLSLILFTTILGFLLFINTASAGNLLTITHDGNILGGSPIFNLDDMKPGDTISEEILINNVSDNTYTISVICEEVEELKNFSEVLEITLTGPGGEIFSGSVAEFCEQSAGSEGMTWDSISGNSQHAYQIEVYFPHEAGNEYQQAKYVFNLIFGVLITDHLVINEVYYFEKECEESCSCCCTPDVDAEISGNAEGSTNIIDINIANTCLAVQTNEATVTNSISVSSNTGGNTIYGNTGGSFFTQTGSSSFSFNIFNLFNINFATSCDDGEKPGGEWIEIYNPTEVNISLENWYLEENSGDRIMIQDNIVIGPGEFLIIARDDKACDCWIDGQPVDVLEIPSVFGNGLDNMGDHIYLINPQGETVDKVGWGINTAVWNPAVPGASETSSIERLSPGFDNDLANDWEERDPPTPGF